MCGAAPRVGCSGCRYGGCVRRGRRPDRVCLGTVRLPIWPAAPVGFVGWVRRLGSSLGRLSVRRGGRRGGGCPVVSVLGRPGRHTARNGRRFGRPLLEKGLAVGSVCGARFRVWRSVPCVALGPVCGARSRVWRSVPCLALVGSGRRFGGGVRHGACVRLPGRGYCSSSVIETLTCSLTKSPASSDAASRGTNSSSVKPIRYSRALYEPFWGPSMSVKFSVRLSF